MRATGWILVVLGIVGATICVYGIVIANQATDRAQAATGSLATEARGLLDAVDAKLVDMPAQVTRLVERKDEGDIGRQLGRLEEALAGAHETGATILSLLQVASRLRGGGAVDDEFPKVVALHAALGTAHGLVRDQRADIKTWTLRAAVVNKTLEQVRADIAETRTATERIEERTVSKLGVIALGSSIFLIWMAGGQLAMALVGRRRAQAEARANR